MIRSKCVVVDANVLVDVAVVLVESPVVLADEDENRAAPVVARACVFHADIKCDCDCDCDCDCEISRPCLEDLVGKDGTKPRTD